jgi:hypothetical protein
MTGKFTVNGANTTVVFEFTASTQKLQDVVNAAARHYYELDSVDMPPTTPFDNLTIQQKLNIVDRHIRTIINETALQTIIADAIATAVATAETTLAV